MQTTECTDDLLHLTVRYYATKVLWKKCLFEKNFSDIRNISYLVFLTTIAQQLFYGITHIRKTKNLALNKLYPRKELFSKKKSASKSKKDAAIDYSSLFKQDDWMTLVVKDVVKDY